MATKSRTIAEFVRELDAGSGGVSTTEFNKLDGVTATTVELNKLAGATVSTVQLNALDVSTASGASDTTFLRGDATWQTAGSTSASDLDSGTLAVARFPTGAVIQTQSVFIDSYAITVQCAANTYTDVPTFQVSITPSFLSSKILIRMYMGAWNFSSTNYGLAGTGVFRRKIASGSFTSIGKGTQNSTWNGTFHLAQPNSYQYHSGISPFFLDAPFAPSDTLAECTYGIAVADHNNSTQTFYLNQLGVTNSDEVYTASNASSLLVQEIAG